MKDSAKGFEDAFTAGAEALADGISQDFCSVAEAAVTAILSEDKIDSPALKDKLRNLTRGVGGWRGRPARVCSFA